MAPQPKPPGQRRRRNAGLSQWRQLPEDGRADEVPELVGEWLESTREWWTDIWRSPMSTAWLPADVGALRRLARLRDDDERGEAPAVALAAIQQLEDRFGLNPKARRNLQWEISRADSEPAPRRVPVSGGRRAALRAVDPAN
jgi:hypothetical protein